jgi:protein tyrosine phosphatase
MRHIGYLLGLCIFFLCGSLFGLSSWEREATFNAIVERDLQTLPPNILSWLEKQKIPIDQYNKVVAKLNYQKIISKIHAAEKLIKKPATYGLLPAHIWKNVHIGCVPYDETRTLRHLEGFYVSASDVLTPTQAYIVGEAPIGSTEDIFWEAIAEANVRTIVALVTPTDTAYWDSTRFPKVIQRWKIIQISEEEEAKSPFLITHRIVRRVFRISNLDRNESRIVTHLHYENWPDHDAPEATLFHTFLALVDTVHPNSAYPIFVHCAAGIGRSGTFVAAHSLRRDVLEMRASSKHQYVNIAQRILEMRMQRRRMLGRPVQLKAVIGAVRDAIQHKVKT